MEWRSLVDSLRTMNWESILPVIQSVSSPYEQLQGLAAPTPLIWEAIQAIVSPRVLNYEWRSLVSSVLDLPWEATQHVPPTPLAAVVKILMGPRVGVLPRLGPSVGVAKDLESAVLLAVKLAPATLAALSARSTFIVVRQKQPSPPKRQI